MEKISKRVSAIEEVNNNVKLLTEMVMSHSQGGASARSSEDLMKVRLPLPPSPHPLRVPAGLTHPPSCPQELYQRCERMRPTLFRLASDTEDNDEALGERWAVSPVPPTPPLLPSQDLLTICSWQDPPPGGPPPPAPTLGFSTSRKRRAGADMVIRPYGPSLYSSPRAEQAERGRIVPISQLGLWEGRDLPRSQSITVAEPGWTRDSLRTLPPSLLRARN